MSSFLEFLPEAFLDAESAVKHYEGHLQGLGTKFWIELEAICSTIPQNPFLWRERTGGFRRVNFLGFPYYVAFLFAQIESLLPPLDMQANTPIIGNIGSTEFNSPDLCALFHSIRKTAHR